MPAGGAAGLSASNMWKRLSKMRFAAAGGVVQWFPGHMFAATRAIRDRLKLADLVIEVRDARIPISSANEDLQNAIAHKRRVIALNKKDLANSNVLNKWIQHFDSVKLDSIAVNAHARTSVKQLLALVELKLKEAISREPTLLVMVVGVPNVGKSALINSIHQIALSRFPEQRKIKKATVGPLPGVTQDIAGFKIASRPSIYVLDTPGVLVPRIHNLETGLKLALTGSVKDSAVGEERLAQYLLAVLDIRGTPHHWKKIVEKGKEESYHDDKKRRAVSHGIPTRGDSGESDVHYVEGVVTDVMHTLYSTLSEFDGDIDDEASLENLVDSQMEALKRPLKVVHRSDEVGRAMVSKKLLALFRSGRLGAFILDDVPEDKRIDRVSGDAHTSVPLREDYIV